MRLPNNCLLLFLAMTALAFGQEVDAPRLFKLAEPSVVLISHEEGSGSGVILTPDGMILTNFHVANTPLAITVEAMVQENGAFSRKSFPNTPLVKVHGKNDLALLKINAPEIRFQPIRLSKSSEDTKAGGTCFAMGFPYLPNQDKPEITITKGIISSAKRMINETPYIQLDAAINPGNSGGALLNDKGILIGIPTLRFEGADRVGLATPVAGLNMNQFVAVKDKVGDREEARRLAQLAATLYTRDAFNLRMDDELVEIAVFLQRQALAQEPGNPEWSRLMAILYRRLDKLPLAKAYAENAVTLEPDNFLFRALLAEVHDDLNNPAASSAQRLECLKLLNARTDKNLAKEVFEKLSRSLMAIGEHVRAVYVISWANAVVGEESGPARRLVLQSAAQHLPEALVLEIMRKSSGHSFEDMQALVKKHPSSTASGSASPVAPADASTVSEFSPTGRTIISTVNFQKGVSVTMADASPGVLFFPDRGTVEWTPSPFSAATEARALFVLKHPDGTEELHAHVIPRGEP